MEVDGTHEMEGSNELLHLQNLPDSIECMSNSAVGNKHSAFHQASPQVLGNLAATASPRPVLYGGTRDKPYPCQFRDCHRALLGQGFPRRWNLRDHMKRVHGCEPAEPRSSNTLRDKEFLCRFPTCDRAKLGRGFPDGWTLLLHARQVHGCEPDSSRTAMVLTPSLNSTQQVKWSACASKAPDQRCFLRKDKLVQHLRSTHGLSDDIVRKLPIQDWVDRTEPLKKSQADSSPNLGETGTRLSGGDRVLIAYLGLKTPDVPIYQDFTMESIGQ